MDMDIDSVHPLSRAGSEPIIGHSAIAHTLLDDDDLSESGLSELGAEIEQNLSSATPEGSGEGDDVEHDSDDAMDIESDEDSRPMQENRPRKRASVREHYDPELYGLRRSVWIRIAPL